MRYFAILSALAAFGLSTSVPLHAADYDSNQQNDQAQSQKHWNKTKQGAGHAWKHTKKGAQQAGSAAKSGSSTAWHKTKKGAKHIGNETGKTMQKGGNDLQSQTQ